MKRYIKFNRDIENYPLDEYIGSGTWIHVIDSDMDVWHLDNPIHYFVRLLARDGDDYVCNIFNPIDDYAFSPQIYQKTTSIVDANYLQLATPLEEYDTSYITNKDNVKRLQEEFYKLDKFDEEDYE